jgi:hypothetical protein
MKKEKKIKIQDDNEETISQADSQETVQTSGI